MSLRLIMVCGVTMAAAGFRVLAAPPPNLDRCIASALQANPDIRSAAARLEAAKAGLKEADSAYYPQVGLSGSWARSDNPPQAFFMSLNQRRASLQKDFNNPDDTGNARASIVAQWRIYDSGRREADRQAAVRGSEAARYSLETVHNDLVYQVIRGYYGILQARDSVTVQEEAVKTLSEHLRVAGERVKAGSALKTDVLNLEVALSQSREDLIRAKNGVQLAVAALNTAIGEEMVKGAEVPDLSGGADRVEPAGSGDETVETRPEWGAAEARVRMAEAMTTRARRDYLPVINAFGSVDWDADPFRGPERSYMAGAAIEVNLFDGFRNRAGVARASAETVAAQAQADKLKSLLALDRTQSQLQEREARERLEVAGKSLAGAEEALRITRERYVQGAADVTELMSAQVALTATRIRQVSARYDGLVAKANVARASGRYSEAGVQKLENRVHKSE